MFGTDGEGEKRLASRQPLQLRKHDLDDEEPMSLEVRGGVLEARDLRILRSQVHDRVEDDVRERKCHFNTGASEVADRDRYLWAAGLRPEPRHHCLRQIAPVDADPTSRTRPP